MQILNYTNKDNLFSNYFDSIKRNGHELTTEQIKSDIRLNDVLKEIHNEAIKLGTTDVCIMPVIDKSNTENMYAILHYRENNEYVPYQKITITTFISLSILVTELAKENNTQQASGNYGTYTHLYENRTYDIRSFIKKKENKVEKIQFFY